MGTRIPRNALYCQYQRGIFEVIVSARVYKSISNIDTEYIRRIDHFICEKVHEILNANVSLFSIKEIEKLDCNIFLRLKLLHADKLKNPSPCEVNIIQPFIVLRRIICKSENQINIISIVLSTFWFRV